MLIQRIIGRNSQQLNGNCNTVHLKRGIISSIDHVGRHHPIEIRCTISLPLFLLADLWGLEKQTKPNNKLSGDLTVERKMVDSYCELKLPFLDSPSLLEEYVAFYGGIR